MEEYMEDAEIDHGDSLSG